MGSVRSSSSPSFRAPVAVALAALALGALAGCGRDAGRPTAPPTVPLSRVVIAPRGDSLVVGGQRLFTAVAYDTSGHAVSAAVTWTSGAASVFGVDGSGLVTALGEGVAPLIASSNGKADTVSVRVYGVTTGWIAQTSATTNALNAVTFLADGRTGFAVGATGTLLRTTDAGATWTLGSSGTVQDLAAITFTSASTGWAAGAGGTVLQTTDGGATWTRRTNSGTVADLKSIVFADALHGAFAGAGGVVGITRDGGATWTVRVPEVVSLNGIAFGDTLTLWCAGALGTLRSTFDAGLNWTSEPLSVASQTFKGVAAADAMHAVAVGTGGTIAVGRPGALAIAWSAASAGASYQLNGVCMPDPSHAWAVGGNGSGAVLATADGGTTWSPQAANVAQALNGVFFLDANRGWAVGAGGRIVHTSHGGNP